MQISAFAFLHHCASFLYTMFYYLKAYTKSGILSEKTSIRQGAYSKPLLFSTTHHASSTCCIVMQMSAFAFLDHCAPFLYTMFYNLKAYTNSRMLSEKTSIRQGGLCE